MRDLVSKRPAGEIAFALLVLTEKISQVQPDWDHSSGLGGEFGYGADFENEAFKMHPYCWCDKDECSWCSESVESPENGTIPGHSAPNFWHKETGLKIWWYKWIGRGMEGVNLTGNDVDAIRRCVDSLNLPDSCIAG